MERIAIGYIRVSTKEQAGDERYGVDVQKKEIEKYAKENGYRISEWFIDKISGVEEDRPEWNKVLMAEDVMNPPFEAVIVFKSDRVARDIKLYFYYLFLLEKKGIKLLSVEEQFDGELANVYRALILFCAEQERKNIALRTSHGRKLKASVGGYAGGRVPLGYYVDKGRLVIDLFEKPIIEYIFKLNDTTNDKGYALSYREITERVNKACYKQRNGKPFTVGTIYQIIKNEKFYQGYYRYGKESKWIKGVHEPILKDD